jgi:hypothetical protein
MYAQVATVAHVAEQQAMVACYMLNLARDGRTLNDAAMLLRQSRGEVRDHARSWGIDFADYRPAGKEPLGLSWVKERRGRWVLAVDGAPVAIAESDGCGEGRYRVRREGSGEWKWTGSSAAVAIKRASREIERDSVAIFGVDDVVILGPDAGGSTDQLAPIDIGPRQVLHAALFGDGQ